MNIRVKLVRPLAMSAVVVLGAGCASTPSVSENQCRAGDWQTIGYRDGANGINSSRLLQHQEACGEFAIVPDRNLYLAGWEEGLSTYCTADNGFQQGLRGRALNSNCRDQLREPYAAAHADGRQLYVARRDVSRLQQTLQNQQNRLEQIKQEIIGVTTAQLAPDLTAEERLRLLSKLDDLADERAELKAEVPRTEQALLDAEGHLAQLDQMFAAR
jgi:hypothetical protein